MQNDTNPPPIEEPKEEPRLNPLARHHARTYALQAMYQWQIAGTELADIEHDFIHSRIDRVVDEDYFKELLRGVPREQAAIDAAFTPFLDRAIADLDPVELAVLRLSTYELLFRLDVPYRVVINEGLELAKTFGSIEGYKFVNGVLDKVAKEHRAVEFQAKSRR